MHQPDLLTQQDQSSNLPQWTPYISYPPGAIVWYAGTIWRCESGHTSGYEPEGAPTNNLHLWTPVGSNGPQAPYSGQQPYHPSQYSDQGYYGQPPSYSPQPSNPQGGWAQQYYNAPSGSSSNINNPNLYAPSPHPPYSASPSDGYPNEKSDTPSSGETITNGKGEKGVSSTTSFFSDKANESLRYITLRKETNDAKDKDELKHELKGKRIWRTGGIGVWSYSEDQKQEESKKKLWKDWSKDHNSKDWIKIARERKEFYEKESKGVKPLFMWKLVEPGQRLPSDALPIGHEQDGAVLYAARSWWEGGIHLGKAGHHLHNGASISYGGAEITLDTYEVLCGPINEPYLVKWMTYRHGEVASVQGWQPIEGGRESDGTALLLAKGDYENGQHPGKCLINDDHACVGYGGGELWVRPFSILAYANSDRR
ncbi:uncharacterized protein L201_007196 [Kwoniella dendrophila CBS 6074]|uniref:Chitin-binding type-3 domain-containing protein n=1 Tax=Kwoniella dendrophila CBS 6074 TaxID=1295534 RepID=A0AAX4K3V6_9TREE